MQAEQISLFGRESPAMDEGFSSLRRICLDETAWVDYAPSWVMGHQALMDQLLASTRWQGGRRHMYERVVEVPRLTASIPEDGPGHPVLEGMRRALARRYGCELPHLSLALYRDGRDSVAFHGDQVAREMPEALVVTISLGEPRRFLLRKKKLPAGATPDEADRSRHASMAFSLGWGDLVVMGGSCQRTWEHAIPKVAHAGPRIVVMFRPSWFERATSYRRS